MAKLSVVVGTSSKIAHVFIQNSSSTNGAGLTGLTYSSAGLVAYYIREGASSDVAITLSSGSLGTYSSGGFVAVDATNMAGLYEIGIPNAVFSSGAASAVVMLSGAANMFCPPLEYELTAINNQSTGFGLVNASANVVQWNGTNVAAPATAGIPEINVKNVNNVSAASVTTVSAYLGTTQPINFTGSSASSLVQSDTRDFLGQAVVLDGNNLPKVDVADILGTASQGAAGYVGIDWSKITNASSTVTLTNTTISTSQAISSVSGTVSSNVIQWLGNAVTAATSGIPDVNTKNIANASVSTSSAQIGVNLINIASSAVSTSSAQLGVNAVNIGGHAASLDGNNLLNVDAAYINAVSTSSVTTVAPVLGTTVAPLFDSNTCIKADLVDIAGNAVSTSSAQIGANVVNIAGTASAGAAGYVAPDWSAIHAPSSTVGLTNTTISTSQVISSVSGAVGSVTGAVGSVTGNVGGNVNGTVSSVIALTTSSITTAVLTTIMAESYPIKGSSFSLAQGIYNLVQNMGQMSITGTTMLVLKRDEATAAKSYTLNSASAPTSIVEAT